MDPVVSANDDQPGFSDVEESGETKSTQETTLDTKRRIAFYITRCDFTHWPKTANNNTTADHQAVHVLIPRMFDTDASFDTEGPMDSWTCDNSKCLPLERTDTESSLVAAMRNRFSNAVRQFYFIAINICSFIDFVAGVSSSTRPCYMNRLMCLSLKPDRRTLPLRRHIKTFISIASESFCSLQLGRRTPTATGRWTDLFWMTTRTAVNTREKGVGEAYSGSRKKSTLACQNPREWCPWSVRITSLRHWLEPPFADGSR